ncbi:MAG: SUMF1/EgtB/PvdO family nonheme iron enzyme, partial [Anaerolineales bacterium]|nr:SUMF1/EgtB/PvdO family nonheme iron enzyme [Anaerolineales bacterium]
MAFLSPQLTQDILDLCANSLKTRDDRFTWVEPQLQGWHGRASIEWEGSARTFIVTQLIGKLPSERLQAVLQALKSDLGDNHHVAIDALCARISADEQFFTNPAGDDPHLHHYHKELIAKHAAAPEHIDERFVALTLLVQREQEGYIPDPSSERYQNLHKLLTDIDDRAAVLLGAPGSGKTTLLKRLQLERAWQETAAGVGDVSFFVQLNGYDGRDPFAWLHYKWAQLPQNLPPFEALWDNGRVILLLDGLNEIPHKDRPDYRDKVGLWRTFVQEELARTTNQIVFSCRTLDYSVLLGQSEGITVRQIRVQPLSQPQMQEFMQVYIPDEAERVWAKLKENMQQLDLFTVPFFLRLLVDGVAATGEIPLGRAALITSFIRRALLREIERHHYLFQPNELLDEDDCWQIANRQWGSPLDLPEGGLLVAKLSQLAFDMQNGRAGGDSGQVRLKLKAAQKLLNHPRYNDLITAGVQLNVLDKDQPARELTYVHQLLQEYFAARILAVNPDPHKAAAVWHVDLVSPTLAETLSNLDTGDPLPPLPATGWEETTLLAVAMMDDAAAFITDLMQTNLPLAARCALSPEVTIPAALKTQLQQALLERIADEQADLRARITAAEALGELGDPRFERHTGPHGDYLLPPLAPIVGGTYQIGSEGHYDDEKPIHSVEIEPFEMAIFPVTNAEYALFVESGGYEDEQWWDTEAALAWLNGEGDTEDAKVQWRENRQTLQNASEEQIRGFPNYTPEQIDTYISIRNMSEERFEELMDDWYPTGKIFREPEYWHDNRYNHPAQPVVGVTWFEARAYCNWLSAQTGQPFVLPTEAEWEVAAGGTAKRIYAYGESHDITKCNTFETHIRQPTPIAVFESGRTPEGIYDLSGNVFEWTSTLLQDYP